MNILTCKCGKKYTRASSTQKKCLDCAERKDPAMRAIPQLTDWEANNADTSLEAESAANHRILEAVNAMRKSRGMAPITAFDGSENVRATAGRGDTVDDSFSVTRRVVRRDVGYR